MPTKLHTKADPKDIDKVIQLLNSIYPVSENFRNALNTHFMALELKKGATLINEGETCQYMYFIIKGALMGQTTYKKKKIVTYISVANEFVSSISGMHGMAPTKEGIIAIEPTSLIAFPNQVILQLFEQQFDLNYAFRMLVQQYYQDAQERSHIIRVGNAKERYQYFLQTKPGYIDQIPLEHIASLLDMQPKTLEKIRKQHADSLKKDEETEKICRLLEEQLIKHKRYEEKDISLGSLARSIHISSHKLSSLLNNHYQQSFVDFINSYRVKSIREQLAQPRQEQPFTIEALAYNAGFSSRSAFYSAFRKLVGISPAEYAQQMQS
ncbi:helix-turn-helix domain-containing protein [Pseudoflavitalea rhizosphaerae]|uniref:helix-turn-helix domain-containing protein n=1 Tax=Pseudoflavitalea rhizosphaerae TaxID=1884793 RepID=UPI0013DF018D|nr:helix-turn-helix domain-containing protein [Pseudoflavitalea rhizosphaerae]